MEEEGEESRIDSPESDELPQGCKCVGGSNECVFHRNNVSYKDGDYVYVSSYTPRRPHLIAQIHAVHAGYQEKQGLMAVSLWFVRYHDMTDSLRVSIEDKVGHITTPQRERLLIPISLPQIIPQHLIRGKCVVRDGSESHIAAASAAEVVSAETDSFLSVDVGLHAKDCMPAEDVLRGCTQAVLPGPGELVLEAAARETLMWKPTLPAQTEDEYLCGARSIAALRRAQLWPTTSIEDGLAGANRDASLEHALYNLHENAHKPSAALTTLLAAMPAEDPLETWSAKDRQTFVQGITEYDKQFHRIREHYLPHISTREIVRYYYLWKTTEAYAQFREETKGRPKPRPPMLAAHPRHESWMSDDSSRRIPVRRKRKRKFQQKLPRCSHCNSKDSALWFEGGPEQKLLCRDCRRYWKRHAVMRPIVPQTEQSGSATAANPPQNITVDFTIPVPVPTTTNVVDTKMPLISSPGNRRRPSSGGRDPTASDGANKRQAETDQGQATSQVRQRLLDLLKNLPLLQRAGFARKSDPVDLNHHLPDISWLNSSNAVVSLMKEYGWSAERSCFERPSSRQSLMKMIGDLEAMAHVDAGLPSGQADASTAAAANGEEEDEDDDEEDDEESLLSESLSLSLLLLLLEDDDDDDDDDEDDESLPPLDDFFFCGAGFSPGGSTGLGR
eukprot:m.164226 g.164226  ORF g.164226 m.164226 type:complete len:672 (+) comp17130_c0_seq2:1609-3624(+)